MKREAILFALILTLALTLSPPPSHALWWMVYHKPEFKGKVIDAETKEPIEGAVVVVVYSRRAIRIAPHAVSETVNVKEALTDKDGNFHISSYTTLIDPLSSESAATFIIFKPGYLSISGINLEDCFSGGVCKEAELPWLYNQQLKYKIASGIVELPKLKTREERIKASMVGVTGYHAKDLPLLYKTVNEEERYLGIPERE